jgi:hypothetical protein
MTIQSDVLARISVRPAEHGDVSIIVDSFAATLLHEAHVLSIGGTEQRFANVDHLCAVMCRPGNALVACLAKRPEVLIGWAAKDGEALLFAYVKHAFRRWGIGSTLVSQLMPDVTPVPVVYWTRAARKIHRHQFPITWDWDAYNQIQERKVIAA